jgi:hypothetical protein
VWNQNWKTSEFRSQLFLCVSINTSFPEFPLCSQITKFINPRKLLSCRHTWHCKELLSSFEHTGNLIGRGVRTTIETCFFFLAPSWKVFLLGQEISKFGFPYFHGQCTILFEQLGVSTLQCRFCNFRLQIESSTTFPSKWNRLSNVLAVSTQLVSDFRVRIFGFGFSDLWSIAHLISPPNPSHESSMSNRRRLKRNATYQSMGFQ